MNFFDLYGRKFKTYKHFLVAEDKMQGNVKLFYFYYFSQD